MRRIERLAGPLTQFLDKRRAGLLSPEPSSYHIRRPQNVGAAAHPTDQISDRRGIFLKAHGRIATKTCEPPQSYSARPSIAPTTRTAWVAGEAAAKYPRQAAAPTQ